MLILQNQIAPAKQFCTRKKILNELPNVNEKGLLGVVKYHDGQFDDARLAVNLAQTIADAGGVVLNYMRVVGLMKTGDKVSGVTAVDEETGQEHAIPAKAVINATGVFVDGIMNMDDPAAKKKHSREPGRAFGDR